MRSNIKSKNIELIINNVELTVLISKKLQKNYIDYLKTLKYRFKITKNITLLI